MSGTTCCCFCRGPLVDGGAALAQLEQRKLRSWWSTQRGGQPDEDFVDAAWLCLFCIRRARLYHETIGGDDDCVWWNEFVDPYFNYYAMGWIKSCSVALGVEPKKKRKPKPMFELKIEGPGSPEIIIVEESPPPSPTVLVPSSSETDDASEGEGDFQLVVLTDVPDHDPEAQPPVQVDDPLQLKPVERTLKPPLEKNKSPVREKHEVRKGTTWIGFDCEFCGKTFVDLECVIKHQSAKHVFQAGTVLFGENLQPEVLYFFSCTLCPFVCQNGVTLEAHFNKIHKNFISHKNLHCERCQTTFDSASAKERHECFETRMLRSQFCPSLTHHAAPRQCNLCLEVLPCLGCLAIHLCHNKMQCPVCAKLFCNFNTGQRHVTAEHPNSQGIRLLTGLRLNVPALSSIQNSSTEDRPDWHRCHFCKLSLACSDPNWNGLPCDHYSGSNLPCNKCSMLFRTSLELRRHNLVVRHKTDPPRPRLDAGAYGEYSRYFTQEEECRVCFKTVESSLLRLHLTLEHGQKFSVCRFTSDCNEVFNSRSELNRHVFERHTPFKKRRQPLKEPKRIERHLTARELRCMAAVAQIRKEHNYAEKYPF